MKETCPTPQRISDELSFPEIPGRPDTSTEYARAIGFKDLANYLELEEEEYSELLSLFLDTGSSDLDRMKSAMAEGDVTKISREAHSLKGSAVTLGLSEIHELAKEIEKNAQRNDLNGMDQMVCGIQKKLDQLRNMMARVTP